MCRVWERAFVWAGGGVFAVSLAACAYAYVVPWATPAAPGGGATAAATDIGLFTIFALHHSLFARPSIKAIMAHAIPDRLLRSVYVWTASLLLLIVITLWQRVGGDIYQVTGWPAMLHAAVQLAGFLLVAKAVARIDVLELAGIRQHAAPEPLQVQGPYRWVRHPIYLAWLLVMIGTAHMTADRLLFAATSSLYVFVAVPFEERSLIRAYGESYQQYMNRVRWRLLPYLY
jgi:protein-S-isoprenylcysteine O-methyltransferase Ste14